MLVMLTSVYSKRFSLKSNSPIDIKDGSGFPFGILQYEDYIKSLLHTKDRLYIYFDTDALFLQYGFSAGQNYFGVSTKAHLADWQNLEFITNPTTGKRDKSRELVAPYFESYLIYQYKVSSHHLSIKTGYSIAKLTARKDDKVTNNLIINQGVPQWLNFQLAIGYNKIYRYKIDFHFGLKYGVYLQSYYNIKPYDIQISENSITSDFAASKKENNRGGLQAHFSKKIATILSSSKVHFSMMNSYDSRDSEYLLRSSLGSSELGYNRLAGFAFSEFRPDAFFLFNQDFLIPLTKQLSLWLVYDFAWRHSAPQQLDSGESLESGTGIGIHWYYITKNKLKMSAFARADYAITAQRQKSLDYWQLYFGYSIIF